LHYVARHQATPEDELRWNEEALRLAGAVGDERGEGLLSVAIAQRRPFTRSPWAKRRRKTLL
jgi:hypothetical protein